MLFAFKNITYSFGFAQIRQITVSANLNSGQVLIIRGPSGAGKSTLLRVLARLQPCADGEVFLQGRNWSQIPGTVWRSKVHYLAQKPVLFDGTVADNLVRPFEIRVNSKKKFDPHLAKKKMQELLLADDLWEQDARTLSGGEAARLALIRALLTDPEIIMLDEPTAALDERSRDAFYAVLSRWLAGRDKAAILISHNNEYGHLSCISFLDLAASRGGE